MSLSKFLPGRVHALEMLRILATVSIVSLVLFVSVTQQVSNDFWLQAKIGSMILENHEVPGTVLFPFTEIRNAAFNSHEWLPSILFSLVLKYLGDDSLPYISGALGCVLFVMITRLAYLKSKRNLPLALTLGMLAIAAENCRHILRPELLSLVLLLICLDSLRALTEKRNLPSFVVYCFSSLLWANTHGSFVLAPLLPLAAAGGAWLDGRTANYGEDKSHIFWFLAFAAFLCTLINPSGIELWKFAIGFTGSANTKDQIIEWIPTLDPRIRSIRGVSIGLMVMATGFILLWRARHRIRHADLLIFLVFVILGFKAVRFLVYIGIATAYAAACSAPEKRTSALLPLTAVLSLSALLWYAVLSFGNAYERFPYTPPDPDSLSPPMIKELAKPEIQGNMLVSYALGAELIYRTYPRIRPSIDSRLDSYGDEYFTWHESLYSSPKLMQDFVQRYKVNYILCQIPEFNSIISHSTLNENEWHVRTNDHKAVLLERTKPNSSNTI